MTWRERFQPASFRGIPFKVETAGREGGRNQQRHVYPQRDDPFVEDLGRRPRVFKFDAFILGADYDRDRDRLLAALEDETGPGELVHPFHGRRRVVAGPFTLQESTRETRIARFSLEFVEAGEDLAPTAAALPSAAVDLAAGTLNAASAAGFAAEVVATGLPAFAGEPAAAAAGDLAHAVKDLDLRAALDVVRSVRDQAQAIADEYLERIHNPSPLAEELQGLLDSIAGAAGGRLQALEAYLRLGSYRAVRPSGTTPLQVQAARNVDALERFVRAGALAGAARAASLITFSTYEDATSARARVLELLDGLEDDLTDEEFAAAADVRATLTAAVPPEDEDLPRLDRYNPPTVLPSLVIAWRLYADVGREGELVTRNRVAHPGFVPVQPLEVLSS